MSNQKTNPVIVAFSPKDKENPKNWSKNFKRLTLVWTCALTFVAFVGSSIYAPAEPQVIRIYSVSTDVASLGLTVYVLGVGLGPLLWGKLGPMGELYGLMFVLRIAWPIYITISAWVPNFPVILVFRFFAGFCSAAPLTNGIAVTADLYAGVDPLAHATAMSWYAFAAFCSPVIAPTVGAFIANRVPKQLWVLRVHFFLAIVTYSAVFLHKETHAPTILAARAKKMRKAGNPRAWAHHELHERNLAQTIKKDWVRPVKMLLTEPIAIGAAFWTSLAYGIFFFSFEAYPVIFSEQHGFAPELAGLPFLAIGIGMAIAVIFYMPLVMFSQRLQLPKWAGDASDPRSPESTLKLAFVSCILLAISTFWLGWTSGPETHWIAPALSGILFGFSSIIIFFTFLTYSAQTYTLYSASAAASNTLARSVIASIFPVAAHSIIGTLGTKWGVSLFGFISLGMLPIPIIFLKYGKRLRAKSPYALEAWEIMRKTLQQQAEVAKVVQGLAADEKVSGAEPSGEVSREGSQV